MKEKSIKEIKNYLSNTNEIEVNQRRILEEDNRSGVKQALLQWEKKQEKQKKAIAQFAQMNYFENKGKREGFKQIAGIDEVGRGPLAGPVVAAAVILPENFYLLGINDSKQLSTSKREIFYDTITKEATSIGIGVISPEMIDQVNIYEASKLAMLEAIQKLTVQPDFLLVDTMVLPHTAAQESIIKGDTRSISIAAASIVAKVFRDRLMVEYDKKYSGYDFYKNAGYGTKSHLTGLAKQGPCPIHRKTFAPVKKYL